VGTLAAREAGAFGALAQVTFEELPPGACESPVEVARDRLLGFAARERSFELLTEGTPCFEDEQLDCRRPEFEDVCDLRVGASFELAHDEGSSLVERKA
jgi:hypothetical protein